MALPTNGPEGGSWQGEKALLEQICKEGKQR